MKSLNDNPSKQEEIEFINEVRKAIPVNSYLDQLFTTEFIFWIETNIKEDWCLNLFEFYNEADRERDMLLQDIDEAQENIKILRARYDDLLESRNDQITRHTAAIAEAQASHDLLYIRTTEAEELSERQAKTIMELKAKLYDLMNEE